MSIIRYRDHYDRYHRVEELDVTRVKMAARWLVNTLQEWCENQGYKMPMVTYKLDRVEFTISYEGRIGYYYFEMNQLNNVDDVEKGIKSVIEHFENNYGKRAEFAERLHIPVDIVREVKLASKTHPELDIARNVQLQMYKCLLNFKEETTMKRIPDITKVIHNDPATIVFWSDGTKTVVKAENEAYDPEKGIAMAITKKVLGNKGNYYNTIRKWLPKEEE